jgi:anti-sigma factor RsiW
MDCMECSGISGKLSAFTDNELDGETSRLVEQHLDGCPECRAHLRELSEVDEMVHGLPKIDPSPDFASRVVSAAMRTSNAASRRTVVSLASRLRLAVSRLSEAVFSLFEPGAAQTTRSLDELGDCPPLSMSFVYFKLLDQGGRG